MELKAGDGWSCFPLSADVDAAGMCAKNADGKSRELASKLTRAPTRKPWQKRLERHNAKKGQKWLSRLHPKPALLIAARGLLLRNSRGSHSLLSESHFVAGLYSPLSFISRITFPAILNASTPEGTPT